MAGTYEPVDALADQRIALFRTFLYRSGCLFLTPTVVKEFKRIPDASRAAFHDSWTVLFCETQPIDCARISARGDELLASHRDSDDCRILAEAEDAGLSKILLFDDEFIGRLAGKSAVGLVRPVEFWRSLNIPRGAKPRLAPRDDNPLSAQTWWQWE
jgi:predicted nucleic acid-binding protein